jgi:hypothetical protein
MAELYSVVFPLKAVDALRLATDNVKDYMMNPDSEAKNTYH